MLRLKFPLTTLYLTLHIYMQKNKFFTTFKNHSLNYTHIQIPNTQDYYTTTDRDTVGDINDNTNNQNSTPEGTGYKLVRVQVRG